MQTYIDKETGEEKTLMHKIKFIDIYQFLSQSLESLAEGLTNSDLNGVVSFMHGTLFKQVSENNIGKLLSGKGFYSYPYMTRFEKFWDNTLPEVRYWVNSLSTGERPVINDLQPRKAQEFWDMFACISLLDYHNLYLTSDVFLLCAIFEKYRQVSYEASHLDPAHFVSAPSFSWSCLFFKTKKRLELLKDQSYLNFLNR